MRLRSGTAIEVKHKHSESVVHFVVGDEGVSVEDEELPAVSVDEVLDEPSGTNVNANDSLLPPRSRRPSSNSTTPSRIVLFR